MIILEETSLCNYNNYVSCLPLLPVEIVVGAVLVSKLQVDVVVLTEEKDEYSKGKEDQIN